VVFQFSINEY